MCTDTGTAKIEAGRGYSSYQAAAAATPIPVLRKIFFYYARQACVGNAGWNEKSWMSLTCHIVLLHSALETPHKN
jgi:hypothetical protein